jgi:thiamine biosynthesis lipoprotein
MSTTTLQAASVSAIGTTAEVIVTADVLADAQLILVRELEALDATASRFRPDSEIALLRFSAGQPIRVSEKLGELIEVSLRAALQTEGAVDPTVGSSLIALGYDRDFAQLKWSRAGVRPTPAPGWWNVGWNRTRREVTVAPGVVLDLGATAKAWAADRIAARIHEATGSGVLVNLGGDIAITGECPPGGWPVHIADDNRARPSEDGETIALNSGGLATSSTTVRRWRRGGRTLGHIVDPRTGEPVRDGWRTVSVVAASALDANTASTAAMVFGRAAPDWLARLGLAARLVAADGGVTYVGAWP